MKQLMEFTKLQNV